MTGRSFTRRGFLGLSSAAVVGVGLSACTGASSSGGSGAAAASNNLRLFTYEGDETIGLLKEQVKTFDAQNGTTEGNFRVAHLDASLGWTPRPGQTYGMRYELVYQTGDSAAVMAVPAFVRNTLYFTFSLRYPERVAGEVPKRIKGMRSDRKDMMPSGGDSIIPDVLQEGQD